jgi:hypothetical protein
MANRPRPAQQKLQLILLLLTLCAGQLQPSSCSEGDASYVFQSCHASCLQTGCTKTPGNANTCDVSCPGRNSYSTPLQLRLMQWDCAADCSYHCMWALEGPKAASAAGPVYKYFGKWPFVRVLGAQELASVLFSIANMLAHIHCMWRYLCYVRSLQAKSAAAAGGGNSSSTSPTSADVLGKSRNGSPKPGHHLQHHSSSSSSSSGIGGGHVYPYYWLWLVYSLVNANAWLWSSVFHCRDTKLTERLDYFSADLTVAVGLGVSLVRVLALQTLPQLLALGLLLGGGLLQHAYYMAFIKFDYGYNMKLCIAAGLTTAMIWLLWVSRVRHPGRKTLYQFMALVHLAMLLEVLDFPPFFWLLDAHALWHAATVPLTYLWYRFVFADVAWLAPGHSSGMGIAAEGAGLVKQKQ